MKSLLHVALGAASMAAPALAQMGPPPDPPGNPTTVERARLGKALFWDEQLSSTRSVACGTCHVPTHGGGDPRSALVHPGPDGLIGTADDRLGSAGQPHSDASGAYVGSALFGPRIQATARHTPSAFTASYADAIFWDGRAGEVFLDPETGLVDLPSGAALESQALEPLLDPAEMGHEGRTHADVVARVESIAPLALASDVPADLEAWIAGREYDELFDEAFGSPGVTAARIARALASYQRSVVPDKTVLDLVLAGTHVLTDPLEMLGSDVFRDPQRGNCLVCHALPLMSDNDFHYIGVSDVAEEPGRFAITGDPADLGRMRTPSLRAIELSPPYFHDGSAATLEEVVEFYDRGGDFDAPSKSPLIQPLGLTTLEKEALVAYLKGPFNDRRMIEGDFPFDRPTLYSESARRPTFYGLGTAGSGGHMPRLLAFEPPQLGNPSLTLGVEQAYGGVPAVLVLDPVQDLAGTPLQGAVVHVGLSPALQRFTVPLSGAGPGAGWGSVSLQVPNDPALAGTTHYGQWFVFDPGAPIRFTTTNAFELTYFE